MPYKSKKPCATIGCPNLTADRYCEAHTKAERNNYNRFSRGYDSATRYGAEWRRIRGRYIAAHPLCEVCATEGRIVPAALVHHVIEIANGGTHAESNLQSLCRTCHERAHAGQRGAARHSA